MATGGGQVSEKQTWGISPDDLAEFMALDNMPILPPHVVAKLPQVFQVRERMLAEVKREQAMAVAERKRRKEARQKRVAAQMKHQSKVFAEKYSTPDPDAQARYQELEKAVSSKK